MKQRSRGIALVETLLYVAILVVITTLVVSVLLNITRSYLHFRVSRGMSGAAQVALERMVREVRQAEDVAGGTFGTSPGRLLLTTEDESEAVITMEFFGSSTELYIKENGGTAESLLPATVRLNNLVFRQITTPNSKAVKIEMTLSDSRAQFAENQKFYATAVLRGSY